MKKNIEYRVEAEQGRRKKRAGTPVLLELYQKHPTSAARRCTSGVS
jgi:hypothetical protein